MFAVYLQHQMASASLFPPLLACSSSLPVSTVFMVTPATERACRSCQGVVLRSPSAGRFGMQFPLVTLRFNFALIKSAQEASGSFTSMGARVIWQNNRRRIKTPTSGARGRRYILLIQFLTVLNGSGAKCSKSATGVGGRISPSGVR